MAGLKGEAVIRVQLDGMSLVQPAVRDLETPGMTPVLAIERAIESHLFERFAAAFADRLIKPPVVKFHSMYFKSRYATLPELLRAGYETWYCEISLSTRLNDAFDEIDLEAAGMGLVPIDYGSGISRISQLKIKPLKTQVNHVFRINHIRVGGPVFQSILDALAKDNAIPQPLIANLDPMAGVLDHRVVTFDNMIDGQKHLCDCSKSFHSGFIAQADTAGIVKNTLSEMLASCRYVDRLCHLCIAKTDAEDERYGTSVEKHFDAYIDQIMYDLGVDRKTARAEIMHVLGLSRWQRESALYGFVRDLFPDHRVLREATPEWLGRMRIDIYLPELNLAVEHQGEQHYRPIAVFGGEEAHRRVLERDQLKRRLCSDNGVQVVDFRFDAPLTKISVKHRLRSFLTGSGKEKSADPEGKGA